jgi:Tol biopolymer transport system component
MASASGDGRYLSYTDWETGDLVVRDVVTNADRRLTKTGGWDASGDFAEFSAISPDGSQVAYAWWSESASHPNGGYDLRLMTVAGNGKPRILHAGDDLEWIQPLHWSDGGRSIIAVRELKGGRVEISRIATADGAVRVLKEVGTTRVEGAALSPDGRYLAYCATFQPSRRIDIRVLDLQQQNELEVASGPADDRDVIWSPDGTSLIFLSDRTGSTLLWRQPMEGGRPRGPAERLNTEPADQLLGVTSSLGLLVVKGTDPQNVYLAELDADGRVSASPVPLSERRLDFNRGAEWSPDGRHVAFYSSTGSSVRGSRSVVVVRDMQTGEHKELGVPFEIAPGPATALRWFPDAKSVLVVARLRRDATPNSLPLYFAYYRLDLTTGQTTLVYEPSSGRHLGNRPDLSRDGRTLYFIEGPSVDGRVMLDQLLRLDLTTGDKQELRKGWLSAIAISPDNTEIAFLGASGPTERSSQLGVLVAGGGQQRILMESTWDNQSRLGSLGWTRDGRSLIFARRESPGEAPDFWRINVDGSKPTKLGVSITGQLKAPSVSPDGRRLAYTAVENKPPEVWVFDNLLPVKGDARK